MPTVNPRFKIQLLLQWLGPTIAWVHSAKQYYAMVSLSRVVTWYDHFTVNAMLSKQRNLVNPKANDQRQRRFALLERHVLKLCARHQAHPSHWVRAVDAVDFFQTQFLSVCEAINSVECGNGWNRRQSYAVRSFDAENLWLNLYSTANITATHYHQARNQLGTPGGAKVFWEEPIF